MEGRGAAETTEEHLPAWTLVARAPAGQVRPWKSVGGGKVLESLRLWIEARQTIVGAHPKQATLVFQNAAHHFACETVLLVVGLKRPCAWVKFVQTVLRSDPHIPRAIEVHGVYPVIAQGPTVVWVMLVDLELSRPRIE